MPDDPNQNPGRVAQLQKRVDELELVVKALVTGMARAHDEIESEWSVSCMDKGEYYGVKFE